MRGVNGLTIIGECILLALLEFAYLAIDNKPANHKFQTLLLGWRLRETEVNLHIFFYTKNER